MNGDQQRHSYTAAKLTETEIRSYRCKEIQNNNNNNQGDNDSKFTENYLQLRK